MPISKSRNVSSYVRAVLKHKRLDDILTKKYDALKPLRAKVAEAGLDIAGRRAKLTGGQLAEANRLLAMDPATLACLAKPCRPTSPSPDGVGRA